MALVKQPVTGMRDIMPKEMELRRYCIGVIREVYGRYGFTEIETPVAESLANLNSRQGGENEKLIFRILKRGEKLDIPQARTADDLTDCGLRYDLTVPLVRYYVNHRNELPSPFKALQMGNVFRADRPQKGRFRQFMQCDIDILGEAGTLAETELILALSETLLALTFRDFEIRISDRRLLHAMASYCGFPEEAHENVFITLDKLDKIGREGVQAELHKAALPADGIEKCLKLFTASRDEKGGAEAALAQLDSFCEAVGSENTREARASLREIISGVSRAAREGFRLVFDPTLVRGMGYYTGTIFEVSVPALNASCGGGGRYDKMIAAFGAPDTPGCGVSIGFERIILLLTEAGFQVPAAKERIAFLVEKGLREERLAEILALAAAERAKGTTVNLVRMNKNRKFQKEQLAEQGYTEVREFFREALQQRG